ncbi:MAG: prenyltransferase/squalene oxidase repeat-containing protein [Planctomycetota bacterium]
MYRLLSCVFAPLTLAAGAVCGDSSSPPAFSTAACLDAARHTVQQGSSVSLAEGLANRKAGTIHKHEVDDLISALRSTARVGVGSPAAKAVLGSDVETTAKILTAMGHCHRRYHVSDGPVVRPSISYLLEQRQANGSFGSLEATVWVVDALEILDPDGYAEEIAVANKFIAAQPVHPSSWGRAVELVIGGVRADRFPQDMADNAAAVAHAFHSDPSKMDRSKAADALVQLVACQAVNRMLDKSDAAPQGNAWSPTQAKAFAWLFAQQTDGVFAVQGHKDAALTGFGLMALQTKPKPSRTEAEQKVIDSGLTWLLTQQNEDGTFGQQVTNYTTCVVVGALTRWGKPDAAGALKRAQRAILGFQNAEASGYSASDRDYGSIGYGNSQRGDLSNLHFSIEALRKTGLPADHEALQKAIVFLQRTQNLKGSNDYSGKIPHPTKEGETLDVTSGDDGGATYYPGNSNAGYLVQPDGKAIPRSYGSMTYALLKSYTLAGVKGDDPRVKAAVKWIEQNWTLAVNPGADPALGEKVKYAGLYYYYMVLAQALDAAGVDKVIKTHVGAATTQTSPVNWRSALLRHLKTIQSEDGSWVNGKNGRWMESVPLLCTCYAMVALDYCQ